MASLPVEGIVSRFQRYLRINTAHPNPNYTEAAEFIIREAQLINLEVERVQFVEGKHLVLLKWVGSDESLPAILLNSHVDVVPFEEDKWDHLPLGAEIDADGKIYGRGTQSMKSVGMQYLEAIRKLQGYEFKPLRSVYLSFVPDGEVGGNDGARKFVESEKFKSLNIAVVLDEGLPSPTESYRMFNGEKITWWVAIKAVGQPGHSSKLYDNSAMENLTKSIESIMRFRASQFDQLKAGLMAEGDVLSLNMVFLKAGTLTQDNGFVGLQHSEAAAGFNIHVPPTADPEELTRRLEREWAPTARNMSFNVWRADVELARNQLVTATDDTNPWWGLLKDAVGRAGGATSMPEFLPESTGSWYFRKAGLPTIGFSPISNTPSLRHDHNEYLSQSEYSKGIDMYVQILSAFTLYTA